MAGDVKPGVKARRKPRAELLETPDAVDIAMHAVASGKPLPDVARRLLEEQSRLVRAQCNELRLRQVGERVRAALWAILAITALAIVALIVAVVVRASRADELIVQSFRVPPAMQARGLTGEVVATQVLDKLAEMQAGSISTRAATSYANNWEDQLKIDIPNTGASTDQVWKLLRGWLGKETRISGEVIETPGGLALTTRVGATPGQRFVSTTNDVDELVHKGAEAIYRHSQPYRYSVHIGHDPKRREERVALLRSLSADESPIERKWAWNGLAVELRNSGDFRGSIAMARRALAIDPEMNSAWGNISINQNLLGHDQGSIIIGEHLMSLRPGAEDDAVIVKANNCRRAVADGGIMRDPVRVEQAVSCLESLGKFPDAVPPAKAAHAWLRRDYASLDRLARTQAGEAKDDIARATAATARLRAETVRGAGPALAKALGEARTLTAKASSDPDRGGHQRAIAGPKRWPLHAEALAMLGRTGEAAALIARTPLDCYDCVRTRGLVAEARGDRRGAQLWYLAAARLGPRLPAAFADWGRLLAKAGRYQSAEYKLKQAVRLAPNWADPLKSWGDMLAAQGKSGEALAKYDAALKLAPRWAELAAARARVAGR